MTDWPSFWVNLATAVFTGGTFIMGLFMIPRTRWRMRTIDNKTEDGLSKVHIVLENVGITDVTDVDVTLNHEYSDAITFAEGEHKALVKRGESIGVWVSATAEKPDLQQRLPMVIPLKVPADTELTVTWHQLPFLFQTHRKTIRVADHIKS